jgi:ketosteroid isomerase-like protein
MMLSSYSFFPQQNARASWYMDLQQGADEFQERYTPNAVRIFADGTFIQGADTLARNWRVSNWEIKGVEVLHEVQPHLQAYRYEITSLQTKFGTPLVELCIWNLQGPNLRKELEFAVPLAEDVPGPDILDMYRRQWMELCNAHNAEALVNTLYHPNTLYYNHRPMLVGRAALIPAYAYMNNPNYTLRLEPIAVVPVRADLIFEIGQCVGSYPGKYILVWQRDAEGLWKILLDSNI